MGKTIKDYGAIGNGKTDDTKAIQRAIDDVGIDNAYFPKGIYLVFVNFKREGAKCLNK